MVTLGSLIVSEPRLSKNPWAEEREGERRSDRGIQEIAG